MARLKVFAARIGFFDTVVTAPSQKAALEAWGTHQNLFHDGAARICDDAAVVAAALARPGVLLSRPAGSKAAFTEKSSLPESGTTSKAIAGRSGAKPKASAKSRRGARDRAAIDEVRAALRQLETGYDRERRGLAEQIADSRRRLADLDASYGSEKKTLNGRLAAIRADRVPPKRR